MPRKDRLVFARSIYTPSFVVQENPKEWKAWEIDGRVCVKSTDLEFTMVSGLGSVGGSR